MAATPRDLTEDEKHFLREHGGLPDEVWSGGETNVQPSPRPPAHPDLGSVPHLAEVLAALPAGLHPTTVNGFLATPQDDLDGMTVIEWLVRGGDVEAVLFAATALDSW